MVAQIGAPAAAARAHEELFLHWASLRRGLQLPARGDIDPAAMKRLLPTISLIEVPTERRDFRFRLAGTGLWDVYGREITGRTLPAIYSPEACSYWREELGRVVAERRPAAGVHSLAWRGAAHLSLLWLRLPLASDGENVDMILGYDAVLGLGHVVTGVKAA